MIAKSGRGTKQPVMLSMIIICDNKTVISIAHNPVFYMTGRNISGLINTSLKKKIEEGVICTPFVRTIQ